MDYVLKGLMEIVLKAWPEKLLQLLQLLLKKTKEAVAALLDAILEPLNQNFPVSSSFLQLKRTETKQVLKGLKERILAKEQSQGLLKGFKESVLEPLLVKLLQLPLKMKPWLPALWTKVACFLVGKLEEFCPPDVVSSNTLLIWVQFFMAVALIRVAFPTLTYFLKCIMRPFRGAAKMMKAPGRKGKLIRRPVFENDPRGYFRGLRANDERPSKVRWLALGALVAGLVVLVVKFR